MEIETVEDLANQIADWIGVYGCCKDPTGDGCEREDITCCRVGFMIRMEDRIRDAVENDKKLEAINLKP